MPKKNKTYPQLRARLAAMGYSMTDLGLEAKIGANGVSRRISGQMDWSLSEVYRVCRVLEIPPAEIPAYFPPGQLRPGAGRWKS